MHFRVVLSTWTTSGSIRKRVHARVLPLTCHPFEVCSTSRSAAPKVRDVKRTCHCRWVTTAHFPRKAHLFLPTGILPVCDGREVLPTSLPANLTCKCPPGVWSARHHIRPPGVNSSPLPLPLIGHTHSLTREGYGHRVLLNLLVLIQAAPGKSFSGSAFNTESCKGHHRHVHVTKFVDQNVVALGP